MKSLILPGSTIGIFGSGQLGRMTTMAAKQMGYRVFTYSPEFDSPTGQVADCEYSSSYDDVDAVTNFVRSVDVVTFEFENVDASVAELANALDTPVHPGGWVLRVAQDRILEKSTLYKAGLPVTPFLPIRTSADLVTASSNLGFPIVLKTASSGYDGKGQAVVHDNDELETAWREMGRPPAIAEAHIDFVKEISVVATRGIDGQFSDYGAIENVHRNHILDQSIAPACISSHTANDAVEICRSVMEQMNVVGTLCVEFFVDNDYRLLINEIAPRPHNSGHLTIEASRTSQFEQHVRAICGLPLGDTHQPHPAAMVNLLGDLWNKQTPNWSAALACRNVKLHLYGKRETRPGRKMGHLTAVANDADTALRNVLEAREALSHSSIITHDLESQNQCA